MSGRRRPLSSLASLGSVAPAIPTVGLFVLWAVHNGGYDEDTWYWGALAVLALLAGVLFVASGRLRVNRLTRAAILLFSLYVAWSYLSILWARDQGAALEGSNRALLYLLVFGLLAILPWTARPALALLMTWATGIGVIAIVLLFRLANSDHVNRLFAEGRLSAPTGYFNATAALFTMAALTGIALSTRQRLPAPLRGLMVALATADLDLALTVQSRGWLFTLPLVSLIAIVIAGERLRATASSGIAAVGVLIVARRLLLVYQSTPSDPLAHVAEHAGRPALLACGGVFLLATLLALLDGPGRLPALTGRIRLALGIALTALALCGVGGGALVVTHGHVGSFISRQWHGFAHEPTTSTSSHFTDAGSGRYDFWRVALDAFRHHPVGGLGQDNFADYYMLHRHTTEQPQWTHSLELRLLASTGLVGAALFAAFLGLAVVAALRWRGGDELRRIVVGASLLPLVVWLVHGSIDWFWEMPALSGPALGFLGVACGLARPSIRLSASGEPHEGGETAPRLARPRVVRWTGWAGGLALLGAALVVLAFPYLSVREESIASNLEGSDPAAALRHLRTAERLNPLTADPGRLAGDIALLDGEPGIALTSYERSYHREPGGWFSWFGAGLANSQLGHVRQAEHDLSVAQHIDRGNPAIDDALAGVRSHRPLTPLRAFDLLPPIP